MNRRSFLTRCLVVFAAAAAPEIIEKAVASLSSAKVEELSALSNECLSLSEMNEIFKEIYNDEMVKHLVYDENPFLKLVGKDEFTGAKYPIPIVYGKK